MQEFKEKIKKALLKYFKVKLSDSRSIDKIFDNADKIDSYIEIPPDRKLGEFAFPCFVLAKELKKSPAKIADQIAKDLSDKFTIEDIEVRSTGPYVNFYVDKTVLAKKVIKSILGSKNNDKKLNIKKYGSAKIKDETIMIEYLSPNTNKSLHLGHLRNAAIGISLSNILEFAGFKVIKTCIYNDRGAGLCEAMNGYKMFFDGKKPSDLSEKPDKFVAKCYVAFKKAIAKDKSLKEKVNRCLSDWEDGKKDTRKLWKTIVSWVYEGYKTTYKRLGISFDKEYYESDIYKEGKDIVKKGLKEGIFEKKDCAVIANLSRYNLPDKILLKSDGTALYMTQDIYLAKLKEKDFSLDRSIYVVASEQDNHFRQLFKILELLGFSYAKKCYHLSYGLVNLPSGRMKSREGTVIDADDLIDEVVSLARQEIIKRHNLDKQTLDRRANDIALSAIKFFMIKFDAKTSFVFNPKESLSFEGETGPYVQYTYARICSVIKKSDKTFKNKTFKNSDKTFDYAIDNIELEKEIEKNIVVRLADFPRIINSAAEHYRPHLIARYLIDLSQEFNEFYHSSQIISSKKENSRLLLSISVREVLDIGLRLLGITPIEEM